jgi:acetyl esterase
VLYLHGGGWVVGSLETHDPLCRALANAAHAVLVSVAYRLGPEHAFPAAVEDAETALRWVRTRAGDVGGDPDRVALAGDSAGGNLATVVARHARDAGEPAPRFQALVYPATDARMDSGSYRELEDGFGLSRADMAYAYENYAPGAHPEDPDLSPLCADDLSNLPPALVITAELDPLRDEGEAYAARLREAGVTVEQRRVEGAIHGFFRMLAVTPLARDAVAQVGEALSRALRD